MKNIKNMIKSLLRWARTTKAGDDTADFPVQQVGYLAKVGDSVMWFPYGMHANIPADELVLMVSMQGNPEARVSIPGSPQKRVKPLAASEVVFFHPDTGSKLHFKANGDIQIVGAGLITVDAASIEIAEGATLKGIDERLIAKFNAHRHGEGPPGPVVTVADNISAATVATTKLKVS